MYIYIYPCNTFPLGKNSNKYKGFVKCAFLKVKHNSFTGLNAHPEPFAAPWGCGTYGGTRV